MSEPASEPPAGPPLVTTHSEDGVSIITLNRPEKLNALSNGLVRELRDAFRGFQDSADRAAVLTGAGDRAFSVGADLRDPPRDPELWECMPGVGVMVDKPIVAAVTGHCVGGAYCLVEFSDLAVASESAVFTYPEAQVGLSGGLIAGLAARIPHKVAMEFMLTGRPIDARRACEVGMVNEVVPEGRHLEQALELARGLARGAPLVLSMLKRFVRDAVLPRGPSEQMALARRELLRVATSADREEGMRAFREKRTPEFRGE